MKLNKEHTEKSSEEIVLNTRLLEILNPLLPKLGSHWNYHSLLALKRQSLSRLLYFNDLYQKILDIPGVICEFGVQWGASMVQLINLRGIYEPYNFSRKIIGFDTFEGFSETCLEDGRFHSVGDYSTISGYEQTLAEVLMLHESASPLPHIKKFELVKGNASQTIDVWLKSNPHAIISMAIFDFDMYLPTRNVLKKIIPRLTKGSLLVFDELNCKHFPGETLALDEVVGINNLALRRHPHQPYCSWAVFGE